MMNIFDSKPISTIKTHFISNCGNVSSMKYEVDLGTMKAVAKSPILYSAPINFQIKVEINFDQFSINHEDLGTVHFGKVDLCEDVKPKPGLNIPAMIRCQNCETNYPTKYQYQRHQCDFNAEKVVLKADVDLVDLERGKRTKYDCIICGKQFVSRNNLERHQASHDDSNKNTCEHCQKQFVSENRLRIHKENHCKKAGDISKFYRSDVTVWKCMKCQEVFSSNATVDYHTVLCNKISIDLEIKEEPFSELSEPPENKLVKKISTEVLLQCEFCNRTYADKEILLSHQKTHKTDKNYECSICNETFTSYISASQHWLKKCSENASVFYLPKLTYCEFCDRTFKSHEILYTHKIKKKHYTPKIYNANSPSCALNNLTTELKSDDINKVIEDVLIALEFPVSKQATTSKDEQQFKNADEITKTDEAKKLEIKSEPESCSNSQTICEATPPPEKKRRGRKRKHPKPPPKVKKAGLILNSGLKFQCERCPEVWNTIAELEIHREKEHAATFNCEECGQVLHSARALLVHCRAHKSLKPYVCDTCGRSYSQTSHLWQHMRFHQGIKPFACPHEGCEARYTIRPDLKDHIRKVHTRERPFKCGVCGKCFLTGSVYYQHRLIHTEDRRYGCNTCEKRFFRADALNNHKRIHTNERPYPCFVCGRLFRQKGDRNKHLRTQHSENIIC